MPVGGSKSSSGADKIPLLRAQDDATNQSRRARPSHCAKYRNDEQEGLERTDRKGQEGTQCEQQIKPGQGQEEFRKPHEQIVSPATVISRRRADTQAQHDGDSGTQEAGKQRYSPTIKKSRQLIPSVGVASQQIDLFAFCSE